MGTEMQERTRTDQVQQTLERMSLHVRALREMAQSGDDMLDVRDALTKMEGTLRDIVEGEYEA